MPDLVLALFSAFTPASLAVAWWRRALAAEKLAAAVGRELTMRTMEVREVAEAAAQRRLDDRDEYARAAAAEREKLRAELREAYEAAVAAASNGAVSMAPVWPDGALPKLTRTEDDEINEDRLGHISEIEAHLDDLGQRAEELGLG